MSEIFRREETSLPKIVDLSDFIQFSQITLSPAVDIFDQQVSMYCGEKRKGRPSNPSLIQGELRQREQWVNEMSQLSSFLELIEEDPRALMINPRWCKEEVSEDGVVGKKLAFLKQSELGNLQKSHCSSSFNILVIQLLSGEGLETRGERMSVDPRIACLRRDEVDARRIRVFTIKVIKDATDNGVPIVNVGVDVERLLDTNLKQALKLLYCFSDNRNIEMRADSEIDLDEGVFDQTFKCCLRIYEENK